MPRNKSSFNVIEILIYGLPFWIGILVAAWFYKGLIGLESTLVGLGILSVFLASEVFVDKKSKRLSGAKAVALIAGSFGVRLIALLVVSYLFYRFSELNLFILLLTIAFGFTAILLISMKNWLKGPVGR
ncbi:MAG TPA: hypothetical protein VGK02_11550 [Candidatus Aquicultor sp.]|jgi:hypothetical protein